MNDGWERPGGSTTNSGQRPTSRGPLPTRVVPTTFTRDRGRTSLDTHRYRRLSAGPLSDPVATVPTMTWTQQTPVPVDGAGPSWAEVVSAVGAGVAAVTALATLIVAIVAVRYTKTQLTDARRYTRLQLDEAQRLRREQAAPYVVVYARPHDEVSAALVDLVIENVGSTGARDVRIASTPPLVRTDPVGGSQPVGIPDLIPFLAPHQSWRTFWDSGPARNGIDLPARFTVTATYTDSFCAEHSEQFVLDLDQFLPRLYADERTVHHLGKAVEDLAGTMKAWSRRDDVVRVATYDGTAFDQERARQEADRRVAHADLARKLMPPTRGNPGSGIAEDDPSA